MKLQEAGRSTFRKKNVAKAHAKSLRKKGWNARTTKLPKKYSHSGDKYVVTAYRKKSKSGWLE